MSRKPTPAKPQAEPDATPRAPDAQPRPRRRTPKPADASTPAGIASRTLLASVVGRLAEAGWRPVAVDLTITAARPRLAGRLDAMRAAIAAELGVERDRVSVKASTGNLDGSDGAGRSISALALATVEAAA